MITVVATAGRWRLRIRLDPTRTSPPTEAEARALGEQVAAQLLAAFTPDGGDDPVGTVDTVDTAVDTTAEDAADTAADTERPP